MAVGDIFLQTKDTKRSPFFFVEDLLSKADIVFGNLEVPITDVKYPALQKASLLKTCRENLSFLTKVNFSIVVNLANNHILDYGPTGAIEAIEHLKNFKIQCIGVGRNICECLKGVVFSVNDRTIAFIGFSVGGEGLSSDSVCIAGMNRQLVLYRIAQLKSQYNFVIVSFHWPLGYRERFLPFTRTASFCKRVYRYGSFGDFGTSSP